MNEKITVNLKQPITCCKGCTERHPACHGTCSKYKEQKDAYLNVRKAYRDSIETQHRIIGQRTAIKEAKKSWRKSVR